MGVYFPEMPDYITNNLSEKFDIRKYQKSVFQYSIHYIESLAKERQIHLLYHMATGERVIIVIPYESAVNTWALAA